MAVCLLCLIGLPGSGKTKLARHLEQSSYFDIINVVEYDKVLINNSYSDGNWKECRKNILCSIRDKIKCLKLENSKVLIILDDNFYYRSMRYEFYSLAREMGACFSQLYINTPLETCLINNLYRSSPIPTDVIIKMNNILEPPSPQLHSWEKLSLEIKPCYTISEIEIFLEHVLDSPVKPKQYKIKQSQDQPISHLADLAMRKIVSDKITSCPQMSPNCKQKLLLEKCRLMQEIKSGQISLPLVSKDGDFVETLKTYLEQYFMGHL